MIALFPPPPVYSAHETSVYLPVFRSKILNKYSRYGLMVVALDAHILEEYWYLILDRLVLIRRTERQIYYFYLSSYLILWDFGHLVVGREYACVAIWKSRQGMRVLWDYCGASGCIKASAERLAIS